MTSGEVRGAIRHDCVVSLMHPSCRVHRNPADSYRLPELRLTGWASHRGRSHFFESAGARIRTE